MKMNQKYAGKVHGVTVQKGGVGKSTFSQAIAYSFANKGYKVALVDLDPQSTLTGAFFGYTYGAFTQLEEENIKNIQKMHPLGFGEPDDIASIIEFLLSDKSKWITGQNFKIDGGYSSQ